MHADPYKRANQASCCIDAIDAVWKNLMDYVSSGAVPPVAVEKLLNCCSNVKVLYMDIEREAWAEVIDALGSCSKEVEA